MTNTSDGISILVTGLGGQGVMLASKALAAAAGSSFEYVSRTESRGLSQRGGSVFSEVRFARRAISTCIGLGQADLVLSLDRLEAFRNLDRLHTTGMVLTNRSTIVPVYLLRKMHGDSLGASSPDEVEARLEDLSSRTPGVVTIELNRLANQFEYAKGVNIALLGACSVLMPFDSGELFRAASDLVPYSDRERAACVFRAGRTEALKEAGILERHATRTAAG